MKQTFSYLAGVAERLGCSGSTVNRLVRDPDNNFPAPFMVGGKRAWWDHEIEQWLETRPRRLYVEPDLLKSESPRHRT